MKAMGLQGQDNLHFTERLWGRRGALLSQMSQHSVGQVSEEDMWLTPRCNYNA